MLYVGTILTEVLLFPCFLVAILAMLATLERPSRHNQILVLLAIGVAALAKPLALVLLPGWTAAIVLDTWRSGPLSIGRALGRFRVTWVVLGLGTVLAAISAAVLGVSPSAALGVYSVVLGNVDVVSVPFWVLRHVAGLDLYVVVAAFAASVLVIVQSARTDAPPVLRRFAAVVVPTSIFLLFAVAAYSSRPHAGAAGFATTSARLHERATFVLAPLLLVGLALWLERASQTSRRVAATTLAISVLLPGLLPLEELRENANFQATSLLPWLTFDQLAMWPIGVFVLGAFAVALLLRAPRFGSAYVWTFTGAWMASVALFVAGSFAASSQAAWGQSDAPSPTWIDDATPTGSEVVVLWAGFGSESESTGRERTVWVNELFNRRVKTVYWLNRPMTYGLPAVGADLRRGVVYVGDKPLEAQFVLAPCPVTVRGDAIRRGSTGLTLVRTKGIVRAEIGPLSSCTA